MYYQSSLLTCPVVECFTMDGVLYADPQGIFHWPDISWTTVDCAGRCHVGGGSENQGICQFTHTRLTALCPGLPGWDGTRKVKSIWILLKQETVSGSGISCTICKCALCSRQTTTPAPHCSVFYRPDALPAAQPTASKHWQYFTQFVWSL